MKNIFLFLFCAVGISVYGQDILQELQVVDSTKAKVTIIQDESIEILLRARIEEIEKQHMIPGFRINIFYDDSQNSYEKAMQVRGKFMSKYNFSCDYMYEAPDSKLYIGNFRTKSEAQKVLNSIIRDFPKAFITPPISIDLPDLE